ncbi:hypothetical protein ACFQL4_26590 [Halosimplex aquaticum]
MTDRRHGGADETSGDAGPGEAGGGSADTDGTSGDGGAASAVSQDRPSTGDGADASVLHLSPDARAERGSLTTTFGRRFSTSRTTATPTRRTSGA